MKSDKREIRRYIVEADTGEINYVYEGQKIKIIEESSLEHLKDLIMNWFYKRKFVKIFSDISKELDKRLTGSEIKLIMALIPYISYSDCVIRRDGHDHYSKMLNANEIAEVTGRNYDQVRKLLKSLDKKEVIRKVKTEFIYGKKHAFSSNNIYVVNPYVFFKGKNVNKKSVFLFSGSYWAKIVKKSYLD